MTAGGASPGSRAPAEALPPGTAITFYSYKGGTGRSMAVANTACILAEEASDPRGVLMIDWDLEAPGLHRYFESRTSALDGPGLLELLCALRDEGAEAFFARFDDELGRCALPIATPYPLWMIRAGQIDASYAGRLAAFNWEAMFRNDPVMFTRLAGELARRYRYVLIDARTGMNDSSGVCSMLMPEKLVLVFTPNHQSLDGVLAAARRAAAYRKCSSDLRPLTVFPLASRIDAQDSLQRAAWRTGGILPSGIRVAGYQPRFERLFEEVYAVEDCDLAGYFEAVQVPHDTAFAYGERVAMLEPGTQDRFSLASSYRQLARYLTRDDPPWSTGEEAFDVVLLHAGAHTSRVRQLADELRAHGVNPWLEETNARLGAFRIKELDRAVASARSVAVCVGEASLDDLELWAALAREHAKPIIPIVLEDYRGHAPPLILGLLKGVDFREVDARPMEILVRGLKGMMADESAAPVEPRRDVPVERSVATVRAAAISRIAYVAPFKIHLCWFDNPGADPACPAIARTLYEFLHRPLGDDAVRQPGLEIPVEYGRNLAELLDALSDGTTSGGIAPASSALPRLESVGVRLVIALLDGAAFRNEVDRHTVRKTKEYILKRDDAFFLPVVVGGSAGGHGWSAELRVRKSHELGPIAIQSGPDEDRSHDDIVRWLLSRMVAMYAGRALLRRTYGPDAPAPHLLFSYSKEDGLDLAQSLASHAWAAGSGCTAWLDESDLATGDEMTRQLQRAGEDAVVVAIRTDRYAQNPTCARELLAAKRARVPIVTVLALEDGEAATSAYGGNHRTMLWRPGREDELIARCMQAWLLGYHFRAHAAAALARAGLPADSDILPRRPELIDLTGSSTARRLLVHPDPPLPDAEAALLRAADPSIRIATPTTLLGRVLLAQDPEPPLTGTTVALSLSPGEDLARLTDGRVGSGITQEHLDDAVSSIALAALRSGARLAYGGDFRRSPYARGLIELYRTYGGLGSRGSAQLMYFVDPSARKSIEAAPTEFEPINVPALAGADRVGDLYKVLWSFAMRERMAELCTGRILLGGRSRPREVKGDRGYSGPWPGLLEEAWRTLRRGRALYVAGGFGGAAGAIAAMLATGAIPEAFTSAPRGTPFAALTERIDAARRELAEAGADPDVLLEPKPGQLARMEDLAHLVLQRWQHFESGDLSAWPNGLSLEDNRRLFRSTDRSEITYLVFEGLRRVSRGMDGELKLALYQGDIASVPHVDGYAIAVTPGVPRVGPSATLEARLNRPRVGVLAPQRPIEIVTVTNLPGTCVLVARLDLPSVGQPVHAATVERLAQDVAREADRVGLESVACPAFATEMGLSFQESTQAMLAGFRQGRGHFPAKLVFCEPDGVRYGLLRSALGPEVVELRVGPPLVRSIGPAVLHVSVEEPRSNTAGRVRCTLYIPDGNQSVAPLQEISVTRTTWQFLLRRLQEFDDAIRTGRALWRELLSEEIRTQLIQLGERSLVVLGDEMASRLPWELLMEDRDGAMPLPGGVVRRIALQGSYRHPAEQVERSRLRVLIVADPRRDLDNAGAEADAVCDALGGRADVVVTRLDGDSATIAAVMTELMQSCYDVVHYVGHVAFDLDDPAHGGRLVLADGVLAAEDLPAVAPQLVILSACESGRLRDLEPTPSRHAVGGNGRSLAEAFLRAGVRAFVGTFYATDDESTRSFASIVHAELAAGRTLGNAIRAGRRDLYERRRVDWGNFLLFGDDDLIL